MGVRWRQAMAAPVTTCHHLRRTATSGVYQRRCAAVLHPVLRPFLNRRDGTDAWHVGALSCPSSVRLSVRQLILTSSPPPIMMTSGVCPESPPARWRLRMCG
jgi:hypothetical protein